MSSISRSFLWTLCIIAAFCSVTRGQSCKEQDFTADTFCESVESWSDLVILIEDSVDGDELFLCPFDIIKSDSSPIVIEWGLSVVCVSTSDTDGCNIKGPGEIIVLQTSSTTLIQGLTFRDGDDHAIHIKSPSENPGGGIHTICNCQFVRINRLSSSRGGALMTQSNSGTIYVRYCFFVSNFSVSRGAAIYVRSKQLSIIGTEFVDNTANEWGGAIFAEPDSELQIGDSKFVRNFGKNDHAIVVKPKIGSSVWIDAGGNQLTGGNCFGFYVLFDKNCQPFVDDREPSLAPTISMFPTVLSMPSSVPSAFPSEEPVEGSGEPLSLRPSNESSDNPSGAPSHEPSENPSNAPSEEPSSTPSDLPSNLPTFQLPDFPSSEPSALLVSIDPSATPSNNPSLQPTEEPSSWPSTTPTNEPTATGICSLDVAPSQCVNVTTFDELVSVISNSTIAVLCGGFSIVKPSDQQIVLNGVHVIYCVNQCTLYGTGTHLRVEGSTTFVSIHNMKYMLADTSAVEVVTTSESAVTTFCSVEFSRNKAYLGGGLYIGMDGGTVNIVDSLFQSNEAIKGAAIFGGGKTLNIETTRFFSNEAALAGGAICTFSRSTLMSQGSTFALNKVTSNLAIMNDYSIFVEDGDMSPTEAPGQVIDSGRNTVFDSGDCAGFYIKNNQTCLLFT